MADPTPPDGASIDVARRIGWVLRMSRALAPGGITMDDVAQHGGFTLAQVQRCETGRTRAGRVTDAFEEVLGLAPGALRSVIDQQCRWYDNSPVDRDPGDPDPTPEVLNDLLDRVRRPGARGSDWLRWSRAMGVSRAVGLPVDLFLEVTDELVRQLSLAAGPSYTTRFEALARLRSGPYGELVLARVAEHIARPGTQVILDLTSAMGSTVSPSAIAWALELLDDPEMAMAGAVLLEELALSTARDGDRTFWPYVAPRLVTLLNAHPDPSTARESIAHCLRLAPPAELAACPVRPDAPLPPVQDEPGNPRELRDAHLAECEEMSARITTTLGLPEEPMLTRLLYDIVFSPRLARSVNSCLLLHAVPPLADLAQEQLALLARRHRSKKVRLRAARRVNSLIHGPAPAVTREWVADPDPVLRACGLRCAGTGGLVLPDEVLRTAFTDGLVEEALYAAGMTGSALVTAWAQDDDLDPALRAAAGWWAATGSRVLDPPT